MPRKKVVSQEQVLRQFWELAAHPVNDAVRLAYLAEENRDEIGNLDLTGLTEFKRSANGAVEIRLADRIRILEILLDRLGGGEEAGADAFFRALEYGSPEARETGGEESPPKNSVSCP
jgi:hypothetical protein